MNRPWTVKLVSVKTGIDVTAYTFTRPRFLTRGGAKKCADRMNAATKNQDYLWFPHFAPRRRPSW